MKTDLEQINEAYKQVRTENLADTSEWAGDAVSKIDPKQAFGGNGEDDMDEASAMASFEAELDELISRGIEAANEFGSFKAPGVKMRMSRFAREKIYKALK